MKFEFQYKKINKWEYEFENFVSTMSAILVNPQYSNNFFMVMIFL